MSKELIERIDNALRVKDAWVTDGQIEATAQLLRDCRAALSARGEAEPVATIHDDGYWTHKPGHDPFDRLTGCGKARLDVYIAPTPAAPVNERLREALLRAQAFIRNGIELGFIRMPDKDCPDPAHDTPGIIDSALSAADAAPAAPVVTDEQIRQISNLSLLVMRMARRLRLHTTPGSVHAAGNADMADKAMDYLKRKGLLGSPLREESDLQAKGEGHE